MKSTLSEIDVGDTVIRYEWGNYREWKVTRTTKASIYTGPLRYRRTDGKEIGGYASDNARIYAPGQIMIDSRLTAYETYINYKAQIESTESRNRKVERIRTFGWTQASDELIDAVCKLLDEVKA